MLFTCLIPAQDRLGDRDRSFAGPVWKTTSADTIAAPSKFDSLPYRIPEATFLRLPRDTARFPGLPSEEPPESFVPQGRTDLFGAAFRRQGSISRGFLVGSNRDATVVSGFRLQFAGPLTRDIDVNAALTDENSPIQPEGTTQALREVDRVAIDLTGPFFGITLGDFFFERDPASAGAFGRVTRKVQGLRGSAQGQVPWLTGVHGSAGVVGASSRAEYHTLVIRGIEGVQGPYRLTGKNAEHYIVVIAGSERISINGEPMTRGENQDYIIDYATGEVTFSARRMITSDARIYVDFEYADRSYSRNLIGADVEASFMADDVRIGFSVLQEADDPDSPVGGPLDADTRAILQASGSDIWKASRSGIVFAGVDSLTGLPRGQYALRDTLIMGSSYEVLVYAPRSADAFYTATFSRVDVVPGDTLGYRRIQGGEYVFAGLGQGTHVARQFVDAPRLQRTIRTDMTARFGSGFSVFAEGGSSVMDANRLSVRDQDVSAGDAYQFRLVYDPGAVTMLGAPLGKVRAELDQRFVDERFSTFGRIDPVEYRRTWDLEQSSPASEWRRQFSMSYSPVSSVEITTFLGNLSRSDGTNAGRTRAGVRLNDSGGVDLLASAERLQRRNDRSALSAMWDRYEATAGIPLSFGTPSVELRMEDRQVRYDSLSSLPEGSFRYVEASPRFETMLMGGWILSGSASWRTADSSVGGTLKPSYRSVGGGISTSIGGSRSASASLDLQTRQTSFTETFRLRGNRDTRTTLVRTQAAVRGFRNGVETRALYEFSSQQSSRLERVFVRVAGGTGQYAYAGDVNGNGLADEAEFEPVRYDGDYAEILVPGETLVPVHAVKASLRLRLRLNELGLKGVLSKVSSESYARIEEKSTYASGSSVALLDLSRFLNEESTIAGQQVLTNDFHFNEHDPGFSLRVRLTESRGLTQLVRSPIRAYGNERSVRLRGRMTDELNDQVDIYVKRDRSIGDALMSRDRDLVLTGGSNDLAYRLDRSWEIGLILGLSRAENIDGKNRGSTDLNEQAIRMTFGLPSRGSIRAELRREEVTLTSPVVDGVIPYEMTGGRAIGRTWSLDIRGEIALTDVIQMTVSYLGRVENASPVIHTARAEARAVF